MQAAVHGLIVISPLPSQDQDVEVSATVGVVMSYPWIRHFTVLAVPLFAHEF